MRTKTRRAKQRRSLGGETIFTQDPQNSNAPVLARENFYPDSLQDNLLEITIFSPFRCSLAFWGD